MCLKVFETFIIYVIVVVFAFDDFYVNGEISQEVVESGRAQYQLIKDRGNLPRYGTCWKSAVEAVDDGCKSLSEETQSDIALHLTNCFLVMSGMEPPKCVQDRKPNLRAICVSNMSDRAFNVYTEFYTHVQNMCWFLRGQIWHETISENTHKVGKQLEVSAKNQENLIEAQKESMELQAKILKHGKLLEGVLEELYLSTKAHQDILSVINNSLGGLQAWLVGEISWFDSILFYCLSGLFIFIITASKRTSTARLPMTLILFTNVLIERLIAFLFTSNSYSRNDVNEQYHDLFTYIWYSRYLFICINVLVLVLCVYFYTDLMWENRKFLVHIQDQNYKILEILQNLKNNNKTPDRLSLINENSFSNCNNSSTNGFIKESNYTESRESSCETFKYSDNIKSRRPFTPRPHLGGLDLQNGRYNLRSSKQNTPELN